MSRRLRFTPSRELWLDLEALALESTEGHEEAGGLELRSDPAWGELCSSIERSSAGPGDPVHHITCRTVQSRMLLRPSAELNCLLIGCLARAREAAPAIGICAFHFQSNHYHLQLTSPDAPALSYFMNIFQSTAAKEVNRTHGWRDQVWSRPYTDILISPEPRVQLERIAYIFGQGCASNLVSSPLEWPGACSHRALVEGEKTIDGSWIDRTELYERRRNGEKDLAENDVTSPNTVHLAKLPAFAHLSDDRYRELMQQIVERIEHNTAQRHRENRTRPMGAQRVLGVHPHKRPKKSKRSPAPHFHATKECFKLLKAAYLQFQKVYDRAAERLRAGDREVVFPIGCFPPRLPVRMDALPGRPRAPG
jgi:REP element-mobilizing transposase RayT